MWRVEDLSLIFLAKLARLEQKTSGLNRAVSEGTRNGGDFGSSLLQAADKQVAGACPNPRNISLSCISPWPGCHLGEQVDLQENLNNETAVKQVGFV